ncbi:DUF397 domain-containing protein [Actinomadura harenae]|uniref:DUF397 domain-containing protein n=1 Tax=Actinomadura harenae TaxID=2483351 RepID=A0A3M2LPE9_9ACTN|nr:DUF397 domain-containing protein [Actinomadura harenae]RMI38413.1 DUF397 domain-containing protein [Actinomadura harenae]
MTKSAPVWRKSSRSGDDHGQCVEVADLGNVVGIRDSKSPQSGHLVLPGVGFASLVECVKQVR